MLRISLNSLVCSHVTCEAWSAVYNIFRSAMERPCVCSGKDIKATLVLFDIKGHALHPQQSVLEAHELARPGCALSSGNMH